MSDEATLVPEQPKVEETPQATIPLISVNNDMKFELLLSKIPEIFTEKPGDYPEWMVKILRRQGKLNKRYENAVMEFSNAWNDFMCRVYEINGEFGTKFNHNAAPQVFKNQRPVFYETDKDDEE